MFFALHALVLTIITMVQIVIYHKSDDNGTKKLAWSSLRWLEGVSRFATVVVSASVILSTIYALLILTIDSASFRWLFFIYWLSLIKLGVTTVRTGCSLSKKHVG